MESESAGAPPQRTVRFKDFCLEPFRAFFPLATLFGILGVTLWPLHFAGIIPLYPGVQHARVMVFCLFGGFIVGFLATAMPRMLSTSPLNRLEFTLLMLVYTAMSACFLASRLPWGDIAFLVLSASLFLLIGRRFLARKDLPPPGFVLVFFALACAVAGTVIGLLPEEDDGSVFWVNLHRLLVYQGFILLPILGVSGFLLPRFFGHPTTHDFPESRSPAPGWLAKAGWAALAGIVIIASLVLEAAGWFRLGPALRGAAFLAYVLRELPAHRPAMSRTVLVAGLRVSLALVFLGYLAIAIHPEFRISLLHLTLVGGFALLLFTVATRILFSHSGAQHLLQGKNRWFWIMMILMLLAMATRVSGDFWPKIMVSHYIYGAIAWIIAVVVWGIVVLPRARIRDPED